MAVEELDYDYRIHEQTREGDKNLAVRFYTDALPDHEASLKEGRRIFKDVDMVEIRVRGDRNNIVQRPAMEEDRRRWPDLFRAFKEGASAPVVGTPLTEWPSLPKSLCLELKYLGFNTVEDVSNATDAVCSKMAGLQTLREKAKIWIAAAQGAAPTEALQAQLDDLKNRLEVSERNNADLKSRLDQVTAKPDKAK